MTILPPQPHLALVLMGFFTWRFVVPLGLPDYYQSWPCSAQVAICIPVMILSIPLVPFILKKMDDKDYIKNSLWLAFYSTLPLLIYDSMPYP